MALGDGGPAFRPEDEAPRGGAKACLAEKILSRPVLYRRAIDRLDLDLVDPRGGAGERLQVRRRNVPNGQ